MIKTTLRQAIDDFCEKQPLLTSLVYHLKTVKTDGIPTMGTDGEHLFWNPEWTATLTREEAAAVVYHEVLHCAFLHMIRRGDRNHFKFNIAADYAINPIVKETFKLPKEALIARKYYGLSAEQIYDRLPDIKQKKIKISIGSGKGDGDSQQSQGGGGKDGKKDKKKNKQDKGKGSQKKQNKELKQQPWGDHSYWGDLGEKNKDKKQSIMDKLSGKKKLPKRTKSDRQLEQEWQDLFEEAFVDNYGDLPGNLQRVIDQSYFVPSIDWRKIIDHILTIDDSDYSFANPDRRFLGDDIIMPGMFSEERLQDVIFAFDTSASITSDQLRSFYNETLNLFEQFQNIKGWIGVCDARLHEWFEIDRKEEFENMSFTGGGGTAFEPIFDKIEEEMLNPKAVFYFTDTYGSFPESTDYPVFWMVPSRIQQRAYHNEPNVPFGHVIEFLIDKGGLQ